MIRLYEMGFIFNQTWIFGEGKQKLKRNPGDVLAKSFGINIFLFYKSFAVFFINLVTIGL